MREGVVFDRAMESTDLVPTLGSMLGFFGFTRARQADSGAVVALMLPADLKPEQFNGYPPEARKLVTDYVDACDGCR